MSFIQNSKFKIQNSHKGNISLIMIFVLAIGSIIGLMSTNFLQNMIRETSTLRTSYQSYYLAKAGIELGNLAVNTYEYGFEDTISSGAAILKDNLLCGNDCSLAVNISSLLTGDILIGRSHTPLTNCTTNNALWLSGGSSQIIPLFIDQRTLNNNTTTIENILPYYDLSLQTANNTAGDVGVAVILSTGNQLIYDQQDTSGMQKLYATGFADGFSITQLLTNTTSITNETTTSIKTAFGSNHPYNYLAITNIGATDLGLCLHFQSNNSNSGYPFEKSIVSSTATYRDSALSLQSIIKKILPEYVYNSYQGSDTP